MLEYDDLEGGNTDASIEKLTICYQYWTSQRERVPRFPLSATDDTDMDTPLENAAEQTHMPFAARVLFRPLYRVVRWITMPKLSTIVKRMAQTALCNPTGVPSSEAAHAALLFAHVAWNKALGDTDALERYRPLLEELEQTNPALWNELTDTDHDRMINALVAYKNRHHPRDTRIIHVCGMRAGNVHVEWRDAPKATRRARPNS